MKGGIEYEYIIYEKPKKHNITEKEDKKQKKSNKKK